MSTTTTLPKFVVLQSRLNGKYLRYRHENGEIQGFLQFSGDQFESPLAKLEVVNAKSGNGLVHLRCTYNKKFIIRKSATQRWLVAGADNPEEDQSKWTCTLFRPIFIGGQPQTLRFMHVQLGYYACLWTSQQPYDSCLFAESKNIFQNQSEVFTFVDLEPKDDNIEIGSWGGSGGELWSFEVKGGGITKIVIRSSSQALDSIAITTKTTDGKVQQSKVFGGQGGSPTEITLDWPKEYFTTISGAYGSYETNSNRVIKCMELTTNLGKKYGPCGNVDKNDTPFSFTMKRGAIVGFHGRSGSLVDAIGVHVRRI